MTQTANPAEGPLVLVGAPNGQPLISYGTPLTRLNYFDGKFLRAEDLNREQFYLRSLVELSNQAGGTGVVHGFTAELATGGILQLSPGLAIDPAGRVLLLAHEASISIPELIQKSRETSGGSTSSSSSSSAPAGMGEGSFAPCTQVTATPPTVTTTFPTDLYLIALTHAEALCGQEDVYGKLCEDACVTSSDRPFRKEGVVVRAIPLVLCPPTCSATWLGAKHRRSQVASAYYATERALLGKDMSGARLKLDLWCHGAEGQTGSVVPVAVVSVNGTTVEFLDAWTARRERIEMPPRRFWAWQMMMRPYNVFLAQVLQFQCHLHEVLTDPANEPGGGTDPCADKNAVLQQAVSLIEEMERSYAAAMAEAGGSDVFRPDFLTEVAQLKAQVGTALIGTTDAPPGTRILIDGGIVELPPAGYLPVVPGGLDVNAQVRALLGDGVDLRFCSVRPDYVAHALEEAQHLERICLLAGIDNPAAAQEVDILVPNGTLQEKEAPQGHFFETNFSVIIPSPDILEGDDDGQETPTDGTSNTINDGTSNTINFGERATTGFTRDRRTLTEMQAEAAATTLQGPQVRGAGRSETLATGGGAFHFAGLLVQSVDKLVTDVGSKYQRAYTRSTVSMDSANLRDTAAAPRINLSMFGADRIAEGLSAMRAKTAGTQKTAGTGDFASARINVSAASRQQATTGRTSSPPALWTTMRCDRDPFTMPVGASSPIRLEAAAGATIQTFTAGAQVVLQGDLFCDQSSTTATGKKVTGRAWGWVYAHARLAGNGQEQVANPDPVFIPVKAELELKPATGGVGGVLVVTVTTQQGFEFAITTEWKNTPILAMSSITIDLIDTLEAVLLARLGDDEDSERREAVEAMIARLEEENPELHALEVARATLRENPAVREESNSHHASAVKAIRTIAAALDDEGFQQSATALLFPAAPPKTEKKMIATRDWVLFHRRRPNSCDCCQPEKKVVAPPRRYQVYEVTAPGDASVEDIREALDRGEDIAEYSDVVGVVEFQGETATFTSNTNQAQIRDGWRQAMPASTIIYGAIASVGSAINDGDDLDEQRVGRVADVVKAITPLAAGAPFDVLPLVPTGLTAQGLDGVILLVTVPTQVQTQTHRVFSFSDNGMMTFAMEQIGRGQFGAVLANAIQLGEVTFEADTANVQENSLQPVVTAWQNQWQNGANAARTVVVLPTTNPIPTASATQQGGAIAAALNGTLTEGTISSAENVFAGVDAITIIEPGFQ